MTMDFSGNNFCNSAAKNGCADAAMSEKVCAPPASKRRAKLCAAGIFARSANKLLVAFADESCGKRGNSRSESSLRQADAITWRTFEFDRRRNVRTIPSDDIG